MARTPAAMYVLTEKGQVVYNNISVRAEIITKQGDLDKVHDLRL
jgi:hypothetical protein